MQYNFNKQNLLTAGIFIIVGLLLGWLFFGGNGGREGQIENIDHDHPPGTTWTCSMHPQIREDEPGNCPICGLELVPVEAAGDGVDDPMAVNLSETAMKIAEVQTTVVEKRSPYKEVYLPGKVMADERRIAELTARYPGRIEKLNVNFTGQKVYKGQALATIYSPELITAQKELLEAVKYRDSNPQFHKAARNKLKLWDLTNAQITEIEQSGEVQFYFPVLSPLSGTVTMRHVAQGDYIGEGAPLFEVINLSRMWVMFDAYESDLPWIRLKDQIQFKIKSLPRQTFTGTVTFIDPVIDPQSRVAKVRTELKNKGDQLKPEMLASGVLKSTLPGIDQGLSVPKSAVLWTGKKAVVYVKNPDAEKNLFGYREIALGEEAGDYYLVEEGLQAGELVATNGVFKIDAAAQLQGKPSMMNPEGGTRHTGDHVHAMPESPIEKTILSKSEIPKARDYHQSTPTKFKEQLSSLLESYLQLKNLMVDEEPQKIIQTTSSFLRNLRSMDIKFLEGDPMRYWQEMKNALETNAKQIEKASHIAEQRLHFMSLSEAMINLLKTYGAAGETIYVQHCPMANNERGAEWLSRKNVIRNPYFGKDMITCGWVEEELNF